MASKGEVESGMAEQHSCPRCGYENDAAQSFCGSCGSRLVLICGACGATSPLEFRFCGSCGAELRLGFEGQPSGEERRVVTVLFADLVGFTSRAERLDPEDVRAILTPYYALLRELIESFGGTVEKFIGDAVMGVFGAPVAHGDDPERAVRAALRIRDAVSEMNANDPRLDLQLRIAVNTGEAIVALDARMTEGEGMVAGDVVNTASRLQTQAPTDSILVGEETYRSTRSMIDYEPVEPIVAKGKQLPVPAWRVVGAPRPPGERRVSDVPMVGRERELATLMGVWERAVADRQPHLVTIFGLPGVGKSRLASEFLAAIRESGARVIVGRSLPYGESGAYGAFAQQIKQVAGVFDGDPPDVAVEKLRRKAAELVEPEATEDLTTHLAMMLGLETDQAVTDEGVTDRRVLFFSARRFVEALGDARATVLVFQDLHWADPSLLDLVELLAARVEKTPLLLLTLARPELQDKRAGWGSGVQASVALPLEPLDEAHSRQLAARLIARATGEEGGQTAEEIGEASEGNPLFIEELVASVTERSSPAGGELPTSIRGIIAARLDAIPALERSVLLDASVVGRIFWNGALTHLGPSDNRLPELLDSLEGRDLIRRERVSRFQGQQQFRFKHTLIRDVAYASIPRTKRRERHAGVAAFLEEVHAARDSPTAIGRHWLEAGDRERAADYFVAAAEQASRGWAKEEAVALYREALALVREEDRERFRHLRLKLAVAEQMLFHLPDAERMMHDQGQRKEEQ
jgi:class 3 adenylate cyclase